MVVHGTTQKWTVLPFFFFFFCLNINAFQSPLVQQQDPHDMSALQPWLKFNAMAYHKTEKLTYQILFYFSFCISSSFSASLLSRPSIHPVSPALFPLHFFLVRPFLRVAAPMRTMNDCRASRACVSMGGESISQSATSSPDLFDERSYIWGRKE